MEASVQEFIFSRNCRPSQWYARYGLSTFDFGTVEEARTISSRQANMHPNVAPRGRLLPSWTFIVSLKLRMARNEKK